MKSRPDLPPPHAAPGAEFSGIDGIDENALILHFYGESPDPTRIARALESSPDLRARYAALKRDLDAAASAPPPEPPAGFEARVWRAVRPRLAPQRRFVLRPFARRFTPSTGWLLAAAALLAAVGLGYLVGRQGALPTSTVAETSTGTASSSATGLSAAARERLLFASVESHLAGSERLLTRVTNAAPDDAAALAEESAWAESLVESNRLYRSAAARAGQRRIVALLDELEPLLLELAHSHDAATDDLAATQERIERTDLLFKLRVTGERLQRDVGASRSPRSPSNRTSS